MEDEPVDDCDESSGLLRSLDLSKANVVPCSGISERSSWAQSHAVDIELKTSS